MGLFGREVAAAPVAAAPPHPALASLGAFRTASLADAAAAVLCLAFAGGERPGQDILHSQITQRAQDLLGPATGLKGTALLKHFQDEQLQLVINEAVAVLERSLLVQLHHGSSATAHVALTRRGRRALDSGAVARWVDVPADPV